MGMWFLSAILTDILWANTANVPESYYLKFFIFRCLTASHKSYNIRISKEGVVAYVF